MKDKLDSAIYIFVASIICYAGTYLNDLGSKDYYGIPSDFIELDFSSIANNLYDIAILVFLLIAYKVLDDASKLSNMMATKKKENKQEKQETTADTQEKKGTKNKFGEGLLATLLGLIVIGGMATLMMRFINHEGVEKAYYSLWMALIVTFIFLRIKFIKGLVVSVVAVALIFCYVSGYKKAANTDTYLRIVGTDLIVLDYYSDKAIVAKADFSKNIIYPEYQFIKLGTTKTDEAEYKMVQAGKMKVTKQLPSK